MRRRMTERRAETTQRAEKLVQEGGGSFRKKFRQVSSDTVWRTLKPAEPGGIGSLMSEHFRTEVEVIRRRVAELN